MKRYSAGEAPSLGGSFDFGLFGWVAGAGVALDEAPGFRETLQPQPPSGADFGAGIGWTDRVKRILARESAGTLPWK